MLNNIVPRHLRILRSDWHASSIESTLDYHVLVRFVTNQTCRQFQKHGFTISSVSCYGSQDILSKHGFRTKQNEQWRNEAFAIAKFSNINTATCVYLLQFSVFFWTERFEGRFTFQRLKNNVCIIYPLDREDFCASHNYGSCVWKQLCLETDFPLKLTIQPIKCIDSPSHRRCFEWIRAYFPLCHGRPEINQLRFQLRGCRTPIIYSDVLMAWNVISTCYTYWGAMEHTHCTNISKIVTRLLLKSCLSLLICSVFASSFRWTLDLYCDGCYRWDRRVSPFANSWYHHICIVIQKNMFMVQSESYNGLRFQMRFLMVNERFCLIY